MSPRIEIEIDSVGAYNIFSLYIARFYSPLSRDSGVLGGRVRSGRQMALWGFLKFNIDCLSCCGEADIFLFDLANIKPWRTAFDTPTLTLYVSMHQIFRIWLIPGYSAPVKLVTVLKLVPSTSAFTFPKPANPSAASNTTSTQRAKTTYLIQSQNDLYQVNEFITFWSPLRLLWLLVLGLQWMATAACVVGTVLGTPISWVEENMVGGNRERRVQDIVVGT